MTLLKFTAPDGLPAWIVMEMVEMLRPSRSVERGGTHSVLHLASGQEVTVKESIEEILALFSSRV